MASRKRDNFTQATVVQIGKRAGWLCSFPNCRKFTVGATADDNEKSINTGTASHICAAAPNGPRFDESMSQTERSSARNGIWMCRDHGTAIDSTDSKFTTDELREWKKLAETDARRRVLEGEAPQQSPNLKPSDLVERLSAAARDDIEVFRRTAKWPSTHVPLTLKLENSEESVTAKGLANAATMLDDLIIVAPPGMGKTSTLLQVAEAMLADAQGTPIFVALGDWATEGTTLLESVLRRPAFQGVSEADFRQVAGQPGVALLLDGWNELDATARTRARVQISTLKAELPKMGVIVSTRKQSMDVPLEGLVVDLLPLTEAQQLEIGSAIKGVEGEKIVDRAWRTPGVRDLITNPLYLTTLLSLPDGVDFPTTKEEILRDFVASHEKDHANADALQAAAEGFQQEYLQGLAVLASRHASTAIADDEARRSISETSNSLSGDGQIAAKPRPNDLLGVLVSHHLLLRLGETPAYSFQHQQFQEWYASHHVEDRILDSTKDANALADLKADILDAPAWEESIFFAVERLARGNSHQQEACSHAILSALEVDPLLAAEMLFRATDEVWKQVNVTIQDFVSRWHAPGKIDRAFRFMLTSGRSEFFDYVWPLISSEDDQVSLRALRNCQRFRPSILGSDAEGKIRALPTDTRETILFEIAIHSGIDGMNLASAVAKDDPAPEIQASVAEAFSFRHADRHMAIVLQNASDAAFDLVAKKSIGDGVSDTHLRKRIDEAAKRRALNDEPPAERLRFILGSGDGKDLSGEVESLVEAMELGQQHDFEERLIYEACLQYPDAVAHGILARVRAGKPLLYAGPEIVGGAKLSLEDAELADLVIADSTEDRRAKTAASALGPVAVGQVLDVFLGAWEKLLPYERANEELRTRCTRLEQRLQHVPLNSLIEAIRGMSAQATNEQMAEFADLLTHRTRDSAESANLPSIAAIESIQEFVIDWGARMLDGGARRSQIAQVAVLASRAPSVRLLPTLRKMLNDNLQRLRAFRTEAQANGWRQDEATNEARNPATGQYEWAFSAIKSQETLALMREYLSDEDFGETAARILAVHWRSVHEPEEANRVPYRRDFSRVKEKRIAHAANPDVTSDEAEAIFSAIAPRLEAAATSKDRDLAVALGIIACGLPHGQRRGTIHTLISAASRRARSLLLAKLVQSGEVIDIDLVIQGIAETFEAAKTEPWILTQSDGYELREWLSLIPFGSHPMKALATILGMPATLREPRFLEDMVSLLAESPSSGGEEMIFALAESNPAFYADTGWRKTVLQMGTLSSARRFVELVAAGALNGGRMDAWHMGQELAGLFESYPDLRTYAYHMLRSQPTPPGHAYLARAVAEAPDEEGFLTLLELGLGEPGGTITWQTVERLVTARIPSTLFKNAFEVVPVPAQNIRKRLLAMTGDGGPTDTAARWLREIDSLRDEHGLPETEPRHPDLTSRKPWPILRAVA